MAFLRRQTKRLGRRADCSLGLSKQGLRVILPERRESHSLQGSGSAERSRMSSKVDMFELYFGDFTSSVLGKIRKETYGEDIVDPYGYFSKSGPRVIYFIRCRSLSRSSSQTMTS